MKNLLRNIKYLAFAFTLSLLLYLLLPVTYHLFHSRIAGIIKARKDKIVKIEIIKIKKKEREIKEIKKIKRKEKSKFQRRFLTRFKLDLSVLSAEGDSSSAIISSGFENVLEEGEVDTPPIKRVFFQPRYPERANEEGIEATVVAKLLIDENGNVLKVRIIKAPSSYWGFDSAVIEAAKSWKFEPAKLNKMPVKVWATQVIEFKL